MDGGEQSEIIHPTSGNCYAKNQQKLRRNHRKRKQINQMPFILNRRSKIRALSNNAEMIRMEYDTIPFTLQQLPIIVLAQIVSNLNIHDQKNFSETCKAAKSAIKLYWDSYTDLHIDSLMRQTFSFINEKNRCSLYAIRREVSQALRLIPNFALRRIHFQPILSLHLQDLKDIETRTKKSAKEIYGEVKHLDLRGCLVEYDELRYFAVACTKLSSIAVTHATAFLPNEMFMNKDYLKEIKFGQRSFGKIRNFLRSSLPNFAEMEKNGKLPIAHTEFLVKLLMIFPYLETFYID
uniref:F-box domain-containing protein n=1 Tax=Onchocerca volvulus TaxID=6282 RepID=A0A8R1U084_ONCVO